MDAGKRIEGALNAAVAQIDAPGAPPKLRQAIEYAIFPGGARIRPRLCLAVAAACGDDAPALADASAAALEVLHCASLVHDDMPCFDNADTRRGKPSVHKAFSTPLAVLTGDAMIIMAFELLASAAVANPSRLPLLVKEISRSVGMPTGITAGQGWESEPLADLELYQREKTGSLFTGAVRAGAISAGSNPDAWTDVGDYLGLAYQVADDLCDSMGDAAECGKPCGQDIANQRPNAVTEFGLLGACDRLEDYVQKAADAVPECLGASALRALVMNEANRLVPKGIDRSAA